MAECLFIPDILCYNEENGTYKAVVVLYRVILVDDDVWSREDIKTSFDFSRHGFEVIGEYSNAETGLAAILRDCPDLVVSDIRMGVSSGLDMLRLCRANNVNALFVLVSGYDSFAYVQEAFRYKAFYYLLKPLDDAQSQELLLRVRSHLILDAPSKAKTYSNDSFGKAMQYIDEHLETQFSLEEMANALYLNKNYLSDMFSKRLGQTFTQFRNAQRIDLAAHLIREGGKGLLDVAQLTGFDSASHFCKVFKQVMGVTPQQYRQTVSG